jgi:hypothetical protein
MEETAGRKIVDIADVRKVLEEAKDKTSILARVAAVALEQHELRRQEMVINQKVSRELVRYKGALEHAKGLSLLRKSADELLHQIETLEAEVEEAYEYVKRGSPLRVTEAAWNKWRDWQRRHKNRRRQIDRNHSQ